MAKTYAGNGSIQLRGVQVIDELKYLLNLLTLCWHFSKKPFPLFLEATGYSQDDVILQEPKAGVSVLHCWSFKFYLYLYTSCYYISLGKLKRSIWQKRLLSIHYFVSFFPDIKTSFCDFN